MPERITCPLTGLMNIAVFKNNIRILMVSIISFYTILFVV